MAESAIKIYLKKKWNLGDHHPDAIVQSKTETLDWVTYWFGGHLCMAMLSLWHVAVIPVQTQEPHPSFSIILQKVGLAANACSFLFSLTRLSYLSLSGFGSMNSENNLHCEKSSGPCFWWQELCQSVTVISASTGIFQQRISKKNDWLHIDRLSWYNRPIIKTGQKIYFDCLLYLLVTYWKWHWMRCWGSVNCQHPLQLVSPSVRILFTQIFISWSAHNRALNWAFFLFLIFSFLVTLPLFSLWWVVCFS